MGRVCGQVLDLVDEIETAAAAAAAWYVLVREFLAVLVDNSGFLGRS